MRPDYLEIEDISEEEDTQNCKTCFVFSLLMLMMLTLAINSTSIFVAITHHNATCYASKNIISLSDWLLLSGSVAIVINVIKLVLICVALLERDQSHWIIALAVIWILSILFFTVVTIIGCVELRYQYALCYDDVKSISIFSIIVLMINLINFIPST